MQDPTDGRSREQLLDEIGSLQAKLAEANKEKLKWQRIRKPTHGSCCTCQGCGQHYDDCRCDLDEVCDELDQMKDKLAAAQADSDDNYTQGIQRGGLVAITAINGLLKQGDVMVAREHVRCTDAIAAAIAAAREGSE